VDPTEAAELGELTPRHAEVYTLAAAFYVGCLRAGFYDEATEFAEWFLDTFDLDLET